MELTKRSGLLLVAFLTAFVDQLLAAHTEAKIDFVHGRSSTSTEIRVGGERALTAESVRLNGCLRLISAFISIFSGHPSMARARLRYHTRRPVCTGPLSVYPCFVAHTRDTHSHTQARKRHTGTQAEQLIDRRTDRPTSRQVRFGCIKEETPLIVPLRRGGGEEGGFGRLQSTFFRVIRRETGSNWWRSLRTSPPDHISLLSAFWRLEKGGRESFRCRTKMRGQRAGRFL